VLDLRQELGERTDDLNAARAANRDLMALANRKPAGPGPQTGEMPYFIS
jgi:hypothetical protein